LGDYIPLEGKRPIIRIAYAYSLDQDVLEQYKDRVLETLGEDFVAIK